MTRLMRVLVQTVGAAALCAFAGCAAAPPLPPSPPAPPAPVQVKPDEWNIFPDPTTGRVDVYHEGAYVGAITGDETEDPPLPHRVPGDDHQKQDQDY